MRSTYILIIIVLLKSVISTDGIFDYLSESKAKITEKFIAQAPININFADLGLKGKDIGVGSEGDTYIIGLDGRLYQLNLDKNSYKLIEGDQELPKLSKIAVDMNGTPYVVTQCQGRIYYLDEYKNWIQLPGCAKDIGIGRNGEIWKIGCDEQLGGFGIWKLICSCEVNCNCLTRDKTLFRQPKYAAETRLNNHSTKCYWHRIEGGGIRIDVDSTGNPWVVAKNHKVYEFDGYHWRLIPGFDAQDISVSNDGIVYATTNITGNLARLVCGDLGSWLYLNVKAQSVSVGPYNLPFIIDNNDVVKSTAKKSFN